MDPCTSPTTTLSSNHPHHLWVRSCCNKVSPRCTITQHLKVQLIATWLLLKRWPRILERGTGLLSILQQWRWKKLVAAVSAIKRFLLLCMNLLLVRFRAAAKSSFKCLVMVKKRGEKGRYVSFSSFLFLFPLSLSELKKLESLMSEFSIHHSSKSEAALVAPRIGDFCSAKFTLDDNW